ncbi:unnamed protein product [Dicrocoelium dendriticum]|nr:unnamed protein product [Dicrocoelium dendriticum]
MEDQDSQTHNGLAAIDNCCEHGVRPTAAPLLDHKQFRQQGSEMVNYVADYLESIEKRKVFPTVPPGYLSLLLPKEAPQQPEPWEDVMADIERVIMPGITHWHHPRFHAYFPAGTSYPSMCADILTNGIGCIGFSWASSPACTELEVVMMDWLAKLLQLPEQFISGKNSGGFIQATCSDATLLALFSARNRSIHKYQTEHPGASVYEAASKLVGYYSDQAHCSVERAGLISMLRLRPIVTDCTYEMRGDDLQRAIEQDLENGLLPFFCTATLGTTASCAFDRLAELGPVCNQYDLWLHVDAAYAGSSFICPEYRPLLDGIEYATSFVFNPHKWLLVNFDCSCAWYKDVNWVMKSFCVDPVYLRHRYFGEAPDFRGDNNATKRLYEAIEEDGRIHMIPSEFHHPAPIFFIRFAVCYHSATRDHIEFAFDVIQEMTDQVLVSTSC